MSQSKNIKSTDYNPHRNMKNRRYCLMGTIILTVSVMVGITTYLTVDTLKQEDQEAEY